MRVLIVDDHELVSEGLRTMLSLVDDVELIGVTSSGSEATQHAAQGSVDVILLDVNLGESGSGIDIARDIKSTATAPKVLMLSMFTDPGTVTEAINAGADGYLSKGTSRDTLVRAIYDVAQGRAVLDPHVTQGVFSRLGSRDPQRLTERELTVLQELTHGLSSREIAERIHVSEDTVKTYLKQIYKKLGARDRAEAVAEAFRRGLVH